MSTSQAKVLEASEKLQKNAKKLFLSTLRVSTIPANKALVSFDANVDKFTSSFTQYLNLVGKGDRDDQGRSTKRRQNHEVSAKSPAEKELNKLNQDEDVAVADGTDKPDHGAHEFEEPRSSKDANVDLLCPTLAMHAAHLRFLELSKALYVKASAEKIDEEAVGGALVEFTDSYKKLENAVGEHLSTAGRVATNRRIDPSADRAVQEASEKVQMNAMKLFLSTLRVSTIPANKALVSLDANVDKFTSSFTQYLNLVGKGDRDDQGRSTKRRQNHEVSAKSPAEKELNKLNQDEDVAVADGTDKPDHGAHEFEEPRSSKDANVDLLCPTLAMHAAHLRFLELSKALYVKASAEKIDEEAVGGALVEFTDSYKKLENAVGEHRSTAGRVFAKRRMAPLEGQAKRMKIDQEVDGIEPETSQPNEEKGSTSNDHAE